MRPKPVPETEERAKILRHLTRAGSEGLLRTVLMNRMKMDKSRVNGYILQFVVEELIDICPTANGSTRLYIRASGYPLPPEKT